METDDKGRRRLIKINIDIVYSEGFRKHKCANLVKISVAINYGVI